ncbi:MAG: ferritin family protein [Candidatus Omnitrophota bacterium]|nr:ferritin family protein [Candidatus Omnitrophota bacterium]
MIWYSKKEKYSQPKDIKELLTIALEREKSAVGFYEDMLTHSFASMVSDLLVELRDAERHHAQIIEKKLAELKPPF